MTFVAINPGAGPIPAGRVENARKNIRAFVADLNFKDPDVEIRENKDGSVTLEDDGRYTFLLVRGARETTVSIPAYPLAKVRILEGDGQNAWDFPRLYVDGNSWLWCFALNQARDALWDPYKVVELARNASEKANEKIMAATGGRCPTCNSVLENHGVPHPDARYEYASYTIVCLGCTPTYSIARRDYEYDKGERVDWEGRQHWAITYQHMPNEVLGAPDFINADTGDPDPEACCPSGTYSHDGRGQCIRRYRHEGEHRYRRKEISRIFVAAAPRSPRHPASCACDGCRWYRRST